MKIHPDRSAAFWPILLGGIIVVATLSLSVHVGMLQVLGIPFPDRSAVSTWASFLNAALAVLALSTVYDVARPQLAGWPAWARWLIVAGLFGGLKELFRAGLMDGVVTTAWIFSLAKLIGPIVYSLVLAGFVVFVIHRFRSIWVRVICSVVVAAVMIFAVKPLSGVALSPLMRAISGLSHDDVYPFPYGPHVLIWAYVTYLEPAVACFIAAGLVLPGLSSRPIVRLSQFTLLIMLIKGVLLPTLVFGFYNRLGLWTGVLSESQFLLEGMLLAFPMALLWPLVCRMTNAKIVAPA